jgi:hypothetical protein
MATPLELSLRRCVGQADETGGMADKDADQIEERGTPPAEMPQESQRNLAALLLSDLNTVAVRTASTLARAYALKKILGGQGGGDGGDDGPKAEAP